MKNTLKKSEIFGAIFVMVFGTLMHFFYDWSEMCMRDSYLSEF